MPIDLEPISQLFFGSGHPDKGIFNPKTVPIEQKIIQSIKGQIISEERFKIFQEEKGFIDAFHGTWKSEKAPAYLYVKPGFLVDTKEQAQDSLRLVEHLTEKGTFYPQTQWGIHKTDENKFQLFAVTRKLDRWDPNLNGQGRRQMLKRNIGDASLYEGLLDEDSHVLQWMRRIDPSFDPDNPKEGNIVDLLNIFEASHSDNWAWDEKGILYPIDVEVVSLNREDNAQKIIADWAKNKTQQDNKSK